jgi:hypothetical protein
MGGEEADRAYSCRRWVSIPFSTRGCLLIRLQSNRRGRCVMRRLLRGRVGTGALSVDHDGTFPSSRSFVLKFLAYNFPRARVFCALDFPARLGYFVLVPNLVFSYLYPYRYLLPPRATPLLIAASGLSTITVVRLR